MKLVLLILYVTVTMSFAYSHTDSSLSYHSWENLINTNEKYDCGKSSSWSVS